MGKNKVFESSVTLFLGPHDQQITCVPLASEQLPWHQGSLDVGSEWRSRVAGAECSSGSVSSMKHSEERSWGVPVLWVGCC